MIMINQFNFSMFPLAATFMYIPIQQHDYLNHLSSLSLGSKSSNAIDSLFYFYLCNNKNSNNVISNSIKELELGFCNFGSNYFWLNGFPNLKSLSISGHYGITVVMDDIDKNDDDKYSSSMYFREVLCYLKKKTKQQQQTLKDLSSSSLTAVETAISFYKLKKLEIKNCHVNFKKHEWSGFFKKLPYLKIIILSNINRINTINNKNERKLVKLPVEQATFDLSHLSLDLLKINLFNYEPYFVWKTCKKHYVKELMINETYLDKVYYVGPDNISNDTPFHNSNSTTLNIKCKYIEHIDFHNH